MWSQTIELEIDILWELIPYNKSIPALNVRVETQSTFMMHIAMLSKTTWVLIIISMSL